MNQYQYAIAVHEDRLRTAERRRHARALAREAPTRPTRSPWRDVIRAFRPAAAATAVQ